MQSDATPTPPRRRWGIRHALVFLFAGTLLLSVGLWFVANHLIGQIYVDNGTGSALTILVDGTRKASIDAGERTSVTLFGGHEMRVTALGSDGGIIDEVVVAPTSAHLWNVARAHCYSLSWQQMQGHLEEPQRPDEHLGNPALWTPPLLAAPVELWTKPEPRWRPDQRKDPAIWVPHIQLEPCGISPDGGR